MLHPTFDKYPHGSGSNTTSPLPIPVPSIHPSSYPPNTDHTHKEQLVDTSSSFLRTFLAALVGTSCMRRVMEMRPRDLAAVLAMSCLLLLPLLVSSVPTSGSLHLSSQQQHPSSLNISADDMVAPVTDVEVNDYPAPGANNRHNPRHPPGRE
uniref:Uncharacterized protein n=1 Tax=Oryza punctata TaxID=4537 RepID=A0A0E0L417_ORYPU